MASLIDSLLKEKLISAEQLNVAKEKQLGTKRPLEEILIELGFLRESDLTRIASRCYNMPVVTIDTDRDPTLFNLIPYELAKQYSVLPLKKEGNVLILAMANPHNVIAIDDIRAVVDMQIKPVLCYRSQITKLLKEHQESDKEKESTFGDNEVKVKDVDEEEEQKKKEEDENRSLEEQAAELGIVKVELTGGKRISIKDLEEDGSPTVKLVNLILADAIKDKASDIHIEPREDCVEIRYRIDGDLKSIMKVPINLHHKMIARIKILAKLDITQDIKPQDGRLHLTINDRKVDFRISTIPTYYGEKAVIRVLDAKEAKTNLGSIGLTEEETNMLAEAITQPQGMVLVTGPTGSGKTSTLYASLNYVKGETTNIVTIEDPIEFVNEGINQIQVNPARGVTFASGLRSILRQDPNVILVGEIRDLETAEIALKAAITGHLVLSTLHTNSAIATISRLADIGMDRYMISSALVMIVSQRLVKTICQNCRIEYVPDKAYLNQYAKVIEKHNITKFYKGEGCQKCRFSGYTGRTGVFEILRISETLKDLIAKNAAEEILRKEAMRRGLKLIVTNGIDKVKNGITTFEEAEKSLGKLDKEEEDKVAIEDVEKILSQEAKRPAPAFVTKPQPIADNMPSVEDLVKKTNEDLKVTDASESVVKEIQSEEVKPKSAKEESLDKKLSNLISAEVKEDEIVKPKSETIVKKEAPLRKPVIEPLEEIIPPPVKKPEPKPKIEEPPPILEELPKAVIKEEPKPVVKESPKPPEPPKAEEPAKEIVKPKILIGEDDEDIQKILVKYLEMNGYNVIKAIDGKDVLVKTFRDKPDLIIMDIRMPEMDGIEAIKILRARLETAFVPIIVLTGILEKDSEDDAFNAGANEFYTKPCNYPKLMASIATLLKNNSIKNNLS